MSRISDILSKQVAVAETLLQRAIAIPDGDRNTRVAGYIRYDESITRPLAKDVEAWQTETTELLRVLYGEEARQVADFERCINNKNHYFKFREGIQSEIQDCISQLNALIMADAMMQETLVTGSKESPEVKKPPMVFISHAESDKKFANEIVTLLEFIGVKGKENLLCTSVDGYRVPLGCDIIEYLRETFNKNNLFVIILHTHNYYTRPVCMNEMGAAWALKTKYFSVLASDFSFNEMTGVVNNKDIAIKIGADDCEARINQLKNELVKFFGLQQPDEDRWPHYRSSFIGNCLKFKSSKNNEATPKEATEPSSSNGLIALSHSFRCFEDGDGCYPFQIDVKFAAQDEDVYFKSIRLTNKRHFVELDGYGANNDGLCLRKYLKPNAIDIEYSKNNNYSHLVEEHYQMSANYVEDHKLNKNALETMSFHGIIGLRRHMDGYDDIELDGWELHVSYNIKGEIVIPLNTIIV